MLSSAEKNKVIHEFNNSSKAYEWLKQKYCIHQTFEFQAKVSPDANAVVETDGITTEHSYFKLNIQANQLCNFLRFSMTIVKGETVVPVFMGRGVNAIVSWLAVMKAGGIVLQIDPSWPNDRITLIIKEANAKFIIAEERTSAKAVLCASSEILLIVYDR
jgi:non-ribosomal peptide synthetase component F